ncbi:hypothetical protein MPNT_10136 [Candidatus Methylacidithermus pantelleriae]|uniref:Uncharacterized protein n=1 Tax=Candidatus Methylacidithermus pantelleriae TaxID=2744239 RepID=A0A8J2FRJ9_9BACT|nr:hypothetical protein MPNT_10136 [Candidatus Methylacidithermus pantelleriae]
MRLIWALAKLHRGMEGRSKNASSRDARPAPSNRQSLRKREAGSAQAGKTGESRWVTSGSGEEFSLFSVRVWLRKARSFGEKDDTRQGLGVALEDLR